MKEPIPLEFSRRGVGLEPSDRQAITDTLVRVSRRSQILWGEHCSECAAPSCYFSCDFYTPRGDGHCRRFARGIEIYDDAGLGAGVAMGLLFRRWGKLEGRGAARSLSIPAARAAEARYGVVERLSGSGLGGKSLQRPLFSRLIRRRWNAGDGVLSDFESFVVEGRLRSGQSQAFTLTVTPQDKHAEGLFQTRFTLSGAWTRTVIDLSQMARGLDLASPRLIQIEPVGEAQGVDALFGLCEFVSWKSGMKPKVAQAPQGQTRAKLVVWDLDNTVWDGVLAEDGVEGVRLRPNIRELMEKLDQRGVLQSVASKNAPEEGLAALRHFGLADYMLAPQISWGPKSRAVNALAETLSLGVDSFVFIDDQIFERQEVASLHPQVTTLPDTAIDGLLDLPLFDLPITDESRRRRSLYQVEAQRAQAASGFDERDIETFLRDCALRLTLEPLGEVNLERVYELSQRTNQLNVAATRYSRDDLMALIRDQTCEAFALRCADRFGDYGLIGFVSWRPGEGAVQDFFMSCRVQRKRVEAALFSWMAARARALGASHLSVRWRRAARNGLVVEMFKSLGFEHRKDDEDQGDLRRDTGPGFEGADIVAVDARLLGMGE